MSEINFVVVNVKREHGDGSVALMGIDLEPIIPEIPGLILEQMSCAADIPSLSNKQVHL